jgi:hypothetical protein
MVPTTLQLPVVCVPFLAFILCSSRIFPAGYTYFKGEFRRQYLPQEIARREEEIISFLERIDADIPGATQDFKVYTSNTAREIKGYMNVSITILIARNFNTPIPHDCFQRLQQVESCNSWFMEMHREVKIAHHVLSLKLAKR